MPHYYDSIDGWTDFTPYYEAMVRSAGHGRTRTFVEIGVWQGRSLIFMAELIKELRAPIMLFGVDNGMGGPEVQEHVKALPKPYMDIFREHLDASGCSDVVTIIEGDSAGSAARFEDGAVDFAYIDAGHSYEGVSADIAAWWPKIAAGGVLAGHDYNGGWHGVIKAVDDFAAANNLIVEVRCEHTWVFAKPITSNERETRRQA